MVRWSRAQGVLARYFPLVALQTPVVVLLAQRQHQDIVPYLTGNNFTAELRDALYSSGKYSDLLSASGYSSYASMLPLSPLLAEQFVSSVDTDNRSHSLISIDINFSAANTMSTRVKACVAYVRSVVSKTAKAHLPGAV